MNDLPRSLSYKNADPNNWKWKPKCKARWELEDGEWQDFSAKWYGITNSQAAASLVDPKSPSLSLEPRALDLSFNPSISSSIVVRKSYVTMFDTVWDQAISSDGRTGVIITGQPGIGKTLFSYYLLVRLLQRKQVVLFSLDGKTMFLFYFNEVYKAKLADLNEDGSLPKPISSSLNVFIWSLFDINEQREPERFLYTYPRLPVQTTSPDPARYKKWDKRWKPLFTGLPLWTREELAQGLKYQHKYRSLLNALREICGSFSLNPSDPLDFYPGVRALLEEHYSEEDTVQPTPENALEYLLDAAIERFGYAARDVFDAVFDYRKTTKHHEKAFNIGYTKLQQVVSALSNDQIQSTDDHTISHQILALSPVYQSRFENVEWKMDFKSDWVARSVIWALSEQEDNAIRQQIRFFRSIPEAGALAGRLLEPLAHRYITDTTGGFWPLINMTSNGADPPKFTSVQGTPVPNDVRFIKVKRNIVKLQSITNLSTRLEDNSYYIPNDPTFPLFDAFTIELDRAKKSAILWVFQMTTSRMHGGSTKGFQKIREIIAILKDELREGSPLKRSSRHAAPIPIVQVRYVVVVPKDKSQSQDPPQWQLPKGWNENWKRNDHRGNVYCLELPLSLLEQDTST